VGGEALKHRLAAILAADAAGYSRLMAGDERATVSALDNARAVFRDQIESNQGRVIDMAGDSVLAVFETASGAVAAALAIQQRLAATSNDIPEERRMRFRIGVHLGEIVEKADGTVYGDGVNIAARLEGLSSPGGLMVSDFVRSAVKGKVEAQFEDLGEQTVKNIAEPVRAYRVRLSDHVAPRSSPASSEIDLSLPDQPSIAVLPFANLSGGVEQEHFADGVTEDIITELSRFHSLFVIARNSSFTFKGKAVDVRHVARELGVRYVLEGSIRRTGKRIRVTPQLIDSLTGRHIWAERYDRVVEDVFLVQEEITQSVVAAIAPQIRIAERNRALRRRPENLTAYEIAVRAFATAQDAFSRTDRSLCDKAIEEARTALAIDSNSVLALQTISWAEIQHVAFGTALDVTAAWHEGLAAATKAIDLDRSDGASYAYKGLLLAYAADRGPLNEALDNARRAVELNPNSALALGILATVEIYAGNARHAIDLLRQTLRLSPRDPDGFFWETFLSMASCIAGDYANGVEYALHGVREAPGFTVAHTYLAANYVGLGETERAKAALTAARRLGPKYVERLVNGDLVFRKTEDRARVNTLLRVAAGLEDASAARVRYSRQLDQ
jgi:adenylate cyclase